MKILLAVFQLEKQSGKERDCLAIASHLAGRGHDVTIVTTSPSPEPLERIAVVQVKARGLTNHRRARNFARAVREHRRQQQPDALLSFELVPGADFHYVADDAAILRDRLWAWPPRQRIRLALERGVFAAASRTELWFLRQDQHDAYHIAYDFDPARAVVLPAGPDKLLATVAARLEQHVPAS
jgi:UDP-glucose:(heptosyl)LPS alpha-1,3-glucosyltransferase